MGGDGFGGDATRGFGGESMAIGVGVGDRRRATGAMGEAVGDLRDVTEAIGDDDAGGRGAADVLGSCGGEGACILERGSAWCVGDACTAGLRRGEATATATAGERMGAAATSDAASVGKAAPLSLRGEGSRDVEAACTDARRGGDDAAGGSAAWPRMNARRVSLNGSVILSKSIVS